MLGGGQLALFGVLGGRLYNLQITEGEKYRLQAENNRINMSLLTPPRGLIFDRNGRPLAVNRPNYYVTLVPEQTSSIDVSLDALSEYIPISDEDRARIKRIARKTRGFVPVTVAENLGWDTFAAINVNAPSLPGAQPEVGSKRIYPAGPVFPHVVGYVGAVSERELTGEPVLELPNMRIGKTGIEKGQDLSLRGKAGSRRVEVNYIGRTIREIGRVEPGAGEDITLTVDEDLQRFALDRLGEESGAVCVMDVRLGDVLVLASAPSFDPNLFPDGISHKDWNYLLNHERNPLVNKAVTGQYPPGSTFKMLTALAGLASGKMTPSTKFTCRGSMNLGKARFHCWRRGGHGSLDMRGALKNSCDVYFYETALRAGIDQLAATAREFGIGSRLNVGLPAEKPGLMPSKDWARAIQGRKWQKGETLISGIGQGAILTTPLQLATMTARIANGGFKINPRLYRSIGGVDQSQSQIEQMNIPHADFQVVRDGMNAVSNIPGGTAYRSRIKEPEWALAGKTGTAQVKRITRAERARGITKNKDLPWKFRDHALFVAFAPVHDPRYAISVVIEHGGSGSRAAAPVARDIMRETLRRNPLSLTSTPLSTGAG